MGVVQGRADEVGHAGIDHGETFGATVLNVEDACDETAALSDYRTAELEVELLSLAETQMVAESLEVTLEVGYGMAVRISIIDAETSAYVDGGECHTLSFPFILKTVDGVAKHYERLVLGYLGSDVEMEADEVDVLYG